MIDRTAATQAARDAQYRKLEDEVDPGRVLTPKERAKRVECLRKAQMQRVALKGTRASVKAAAKRREVKRRNTKDVPASQPSCDTPGSAAGGDSNQGGAA
ncbi:hypothetical protein [Mycobacterium sp. UM_CSW]|uniref:hypothetical protein n=1 Tax=Mycobacterium sp. UM_CSW TaxID=1370119 RepID=UPI0004231332|nr:hypothetical protein [Mycobacterium sp. UM_CSW]